MKAHVLTSQAQRLRLRCPPRCPAWELRRFVHLWFWDRPVKVTKKTDPVGNPIIIWVCSYVLCYCSLLKCIPNCSRLFGFGWHKPKAKLQDVVWRHKIFYFLLGWLGEVRMNNMAGYQGKMCSFESHALLRTHFLVVPQVSRVFVETTLGCDFGTPNWIRMIRVIRQFQQLWRLCGDFHRNKLARYPNGRFVQVVVPSNGPCVWKIQKFPLTCITYDIPRGSMYGIYLPTFTLNTWPFV